MHTYGIYFIHEAPVCQEHKADTTVRNSEKYGMNLSLEDTG